MSVALAWPDVLDVPSDMCRYVRTLQTCSGYCMSLDVRHAGTWVDIWLGDVRMLYMQCPEILDITDVAKCTEYVLDEHVLGCLRHSLTWGDTGRM